MKINQKTKKPKIASEDKMREGILIRARYMGIFDDVKRILDRYDISLKACKNAIEREQMAILGAIEIHRALKFKGALIISGVEILPAEDGFIPSEKNDPWTV